MRCFAKPEHREGVMHVAKLAHVNFIGDEEDIAVVVRVAEGFQHTLQI